MLADVVARRVHPTEVGSAVGVDVEGYDDHDRVGGRDRLGVVGGRAQPAGRHEPGEVLVEVVLAGEGQRSRVDGGHRVGVDVDAHDLVAAVGELRGEGKPDLAKPDDGDLHEVLSSETSMVRDSRADREAGLGDPHRLHPLAHGDHVARAAHHRVTEVLVLNAQGLALGDGEPRHVALAHATERHDLVPLGQHLAVLVERQVAVQGVGRRRPRGHR